MSAFGDAIRELAEKRMRLLMRHRERYVKAWIASTGLRPEESELIEETFPMDSDGVIRTRVTLRKRA